MLFWRTLTFSVTVVIHNNFCLEIYNIAKSIQSVYTRVINIIVPEDQVSKYNVKVIHTLSCPSLLRMGWEGNSKKKNLV